MMIRDRSSISLPSRKLHHSNRCQARSSHRQARLRLLEGREREEEPAREPEPEMAPVMVQGWDRDVTTELEAALLAAAMT
jgi:hypothetical protein